MQSYQNSKMRSRQLLVGFEINFEFSKKNSIFLKKFDNLAPAFFYYSRLCSGVVISQCLTPGGFAEETSPQWRSRTNVSVVLVVSTLVAATSCQQLLVAAASSSYQLLLVVQETPATSTPGGYQKLYLSLAWGGYLLNFGNLALTRINYFLSGYYSSENFF